MSFHFWLIMMLKIGSLCYAKYSAISNALYSSFSHLIIMHSFHNGLEAKVKLVSDPLICVSNEQNYSYIIT